MKKKNNQKRNGIVSLWKFIFALVIAFFHGGEFFQPNENVFFLKGYIVVEFFFIISGFYFASEGLKKEYSKKEIGNDLLAFIWKKIKSFFPFILVGYLFSLILQAYYSHWGLSTIINSFWNLTLLKYLGFGKVIMLGQLWYISHMLLVMFILYPFVVKNKENFIKIVSPVIIILGLGFLNHTYGSINHLDKIFYTLIPTGVIRAFADINIGMIAYLISTKISKVNFTKLFKILFSIFGELLLIVILIAANCITEIKKFELIILLMFFVSTIIITSGISIEKSFLSNKFVYYLEKLSLPIYINHTIFIVLLKYSELFINYNSTTKSLMMIVLTTIFSIIEMTIIEFFKKKKILTKFKKLIIEE